MPDNRDLPHDELSFTVQQPAFLPWPGFFVRAFRADVVVLLDSVQFPRGFTWINRNRIKTPAGEHWLSVPVNRKGLGLQPVNRITLYPDSRWRKKLVMCLKHSYCHAPFFKKIYPFFQELYDRPPTGLIDCNLAIIDFFFEQFGLTPGYRLLSEQEVQGSGTQLIASIGAGLGCRTYIAPVAAKRHIDVRVLHDAGISVEWFSYRHPVYPQLWGEFVPDLSALDILFNYGPMAWDIISDVQQWQPSVV